MLNLEQDHKRWSDRHPLISAEIAALKPDVIAFNEVSVPLQTAKLLRDAAIAATGIPHKLIQQTSVSVMSSPNLRSRGLPQHRQTVGPGSTTRSRGRCSGKGWRAGC